MTSFYVMLQLLIQCRFNHVEAFAWRLCRVVLWCPGHIVDAAASCQAAQSSFMTIWSCCWRIRRASNIHDSLTTVWLSWHNYVAPSYHKDQRHFGLQMDSFAWPHQYIVSWHSCLIGAIPRWLLLIYLNNIAVAFFVLLIWRTFDNCQASSFNVFISIAQRTSFLFYNFLHSGRFHVFAMGVVSFNLHN